MVAMTTAMVEARMKPPDPAILSRPSTPSVVLDRLSASNVVLPQKRLMGAGRAVPRRWL